MMERAPLPTREQVQAITDADALAKMEGDLEATCTQIETDLDFRPGDDEWHARARGALTAHQIVLKAVRRQLHRVRKGDKLSVSTEQMAVAQPNKALAKAQKQQAHTAMLQATNEARARKEAAQERMQREAASKRAKTLIERVSLGNAFMAVCQARMAPGEYQSYLSLANDAVAAAIRNALEVETA